MITSGVNSRIARPGQVLSLGRRRWSPASLFAGGEVGFASGNLSAVFTDTAGTTPATSENSVARVTGTIPPGTIAVQVNGGLRPMLLGLPSFPFLRFDLSDDALPVTLSAGGTFDVMVFGSSGSWIQRGVVVAPGGAITLGATSVTGAPAGLLAALGDVVGWLAINRTLTVLEVAALVAYYRARGARGLLTEGPELVVNGTFNVNTSGWVSGNQAILSNTSGTLRVENGANAQGQAHQLIEVTAGRRYIAKGQVLGGTAAPDIALANGAFSPPFANAISPVGRVFTPSGSSIAVRARNLGFTLGQFGLFDDISVRELRPEEDW